MSLKTHYDVIIIGAGISGIGAGHYLTERLPHLDFQIFEQHEGFGGTWWTHKYPGVRSDSDLYTYGYAFKPWIGHPIATGEQIRGYMGEVIQEDGFSDRIRYGRRVTAAAWSSEKQVWNVQIEDKVTSVTDTFTTNFLWFNHGYYRHTGPNVPTWDGVDRFTGRVVHPQEWPEDMEVEGKTFVIVGSGATAITLAPALSSRGAKVKLLQRSPSYIASIENRSATAEAMRADGVDEETIYATVRREKMGELRDMINFSIESPAEARTMLLDAVRAELGDELVDEHFSPTYAPWTQRLLIVPDGDVFEEIRSGRIEMVTDEIDHFTDSGIVTASGRELDADVVVTATGFFMNVLADVDISVDGKPLEFEKSIAFYGILFTGAPNLAWTMSHYNAAWTLRVDLVAEFVCRLLDHMGRNGFGKVEVAPTPEDADMPLGEWIDRNKFSPAYWMRGLPILPRTGNKPQWRFSNDIYLDFEEIPAIDLEDPEFVFTKQSEAASAPLSAELESQRA